jgi:ABC-type taurine transport system ATPase subunit
MRLFRRWIRRRGPICRSWCGVWPETGTTILFVTHNIAEAIFLGTRLVDLGKDNPEGSAEVILHMEVPDSVRSSSGYMARKIRIPAAFESGIQQALVPPHLSFPQRLSALLEGVVNGVLQPG